MHKKGIIRLEKKVGTQLKYHTRYQLCTWYVFVKKDRLGTRTAPAAATAVLYSNLREYLVIVSHPNCCAGYIEIAAAQELVYHLHQRRCCRHCCLPSCPKPFSQQQPVCNTSCHALLHRYPTVNYAWFVLRWVQNLLLHHPLILIQFITNRRRLRNNALNRFVY